MISTSKMNEGSDYEFEWCKTCSEYNQDKHCCPRYNKVIRNAVEEMKQSKVGHWISYWDEEARCYVYKCPECGNKQPFDTKYCWECGARLDVPDINDGKLSEIPTGSESEE
jgi:predicted amidophosphoribosyltransferase